MNQDEILNMPAGREMDVLIAESFGLIKNVGTPLELILPFSTNLLAAWEVTEKLSDEWDFAIVNNQNFGKYPDLHYGFRLQAIGEDSHIKTIFALGETAPLAICRAALLTVVPVTEGGV